MVISEGEMYHEVFLWMSLSFWFIFFFGFFCFFLKGILTEWNPDKITSARQAQMRVIIKSITYYSTVNVNKNKIAAWKHWIQAG